LHVKGGCGSCPARLDEGAARLLGHLLVAHGLGRLFASRRALLEH
jgi:hypothetical protein